jgi:hypothetical protein
MYGNPIYLFTGPPEPWWDVDHQMVAAQPFFRSVVHDAVAAAGRADLIPQLCSDWEPLLDRCDTTWSETWFGGTTCHAWSSTPTRDLIVHTLGITPASPGFEEVSVAPNLGRLAWARGAAPTPHGLVAVSASRTDATIEVDTPVPAVVNLGGEAQMLRPGHHQLSWGPG